MHLSDDDGGGDGVAWRCTADDVYIILCARYIGSYVIVGVAPFFQMGSIQNRKNNFPPSSIHFAIGYVYSVQSLACVSVNKYVFVHKKRKCIFDEWRIFNNHECIMALSAQCEWCA